MGAALALGAVSAVVAAGLGTAVPTADAAGPVLPDPTSSRWIVVKKGGNVETDAANDFTPAYLNLTPAGGALGDATAFVSADLDHAYFRLHLAEQPAAGAVAGYVVQFDTDGNTAGWERAVRFDPAASTVRIFNADAANSGPKAAGTLSATVPLTTAGATTYPGTDGGGYVVFSVPRARLTAAGINVAAPMVFGATNVDGPGIDTGGLLGLGATADILGAGKGGTTWNAVASDAPDIDSDGDSVTDKTDNCPVVANPGQEDDDKVLEDAYPNGHALDGTEGRGNVCDKTPRGQDLIDGDGVGELDDQCPEQYGLLSNGCPAQSTTRATLRYVAKKKAFSGVVRVDYDQCLTRRKVTVFKVAPGPDRQLGTVKTGDTGRYRLAKAATKGSYYSYVDPKWTLGARCFGVKSPKVSVP